MFSLDGKTVRRGLGVSSIESNVGEPLAYWVGGTLGVIVGTTLETFVVALGLLLWTPPSSIPEGTTEWIGLGTVGMMGRISCGTVLCSAVGLLEPGLGQALSPINGMAERNGLGALMLEVSVGAPLFCS